MSDRIDREERGDHPVVVGLLALVGVAVVVGVIAGLVALAGARVAGLDGSTGSAEGGQQEASLYLPKPERTRADNGPLLTLAPGQRSPDGKRSGASEKSSPAKPKKKISLQAGSSSVSQMGRIDLTGVYPGGEGAILQVQRFENGSWSDFPVTVSVGDGTFSTYVQTGQTGVNRFRVIDTDSDLASNEVKVTIQG